MQNEKLQKLKKAKDLFVKMNDDKFEQARGNRLREEAELVKELWDREESERIAKNNRIAKWNTKRTLFSIVFPLPIAFYFLYDHVFFWKFYVIFFLLLCSSLFGFIFGRLFEKEEIKQRNRNIDPLDIDKEKERYFEDLTCEMEEIKPYYILLKEYFGEKELNDQIQEFCDIDEEIGSYYVILNLLDEAIDIESGKIKSKEISQQVKELTN